MAMQSRITETPNGLTSDIDIASAPSIVRMLRGVDAQMFSGYLGHEGMMDASVAEPWSLAVDLVAKALEHPKGKVIFTGSGTSGRLSFFLARAYNARFAALGQRGDAFAYRIAGGDRALLVAQENAEDLSGLAVRDIQELVPEHSTFPAVIVGITCGMSATYVGAQLQYGLLRDNITPVLLGFNPIASVKRIPIEGWSTTFKDVLDDMCSAQKEGRAAVMAPVVGPEAITGSTRMKSATATKIMLELMCVAAIRKTLRWPNPHSMCSRGLSPLAAGVMSYERTVRLTYQPVDSISSLVDVGGSALRNGGRIIYLGNDTAGIVGIVDASECPPTYGASFDDVRGFVVGGWTTMGNLGGDMKVPFPNIGAQRALAALRSGGGGGVIGESAGESKSGDSAPERIMGLKVTEFIEEVVPTLTSNDLVLGLCIKRLCDPVHDALFKASLKGATVGVVRVQSENVRGGGASRERDPWIKHVVEVTLPVLGLEPGGSELADMAVKLIITAVSTGAHVLSGTIFKNRMINVKVTNVKLFHRAISITSSLAGIDTNTAHDLILRVLLDKEVVTKEDYDIPVSELLVRAAGMSSVVATALLLSTSKYDKLSDARKAITAEPIIRRLLEDALAKV